MVPLQITIHFGQPVVAVPSASIAPTPGVAAARIAPPGEPYDGTGPADAAFGPPPTSATIGPTDVVPGTGTGYYLIAFDDRGRERTDHPRGLVSRLISEALANEPDDGIVVAQCDAMPPQAGVALAHCADAYGRLGRTADATAMARRAWVAFPADPQAEAGFLQHFAPTITPADEWRRFDRLAWTDIQGAARQELRLAPADRARAEARLPRLAQQARRFP